MPASSTGGDGSDLVARQDRRQPDGRRLGDRAVSAQDLSDLRCVGAISVGGLLAVGMRGDFLGLDAQALVDRPEQRVTHSRDDEESDRGEHDRHPDREWERQTEADR